MTHEMRNQPLAAARCSGPLTPDPGPLALLAPDRGPRRLPSVPAAGIPPSRRAARKPVPRRRLEADNIPRASGYASERHDDHPRRAEVTLPGSRREPTAHSDPRTSAAQAAHEEESALVARIRAGDSAAFAAIVTRYSRTAFAIAFHVLQHREDAEDAVQQAFLAALARIDTYDASRPFGPWLSRVVLNHARTARRARTRLARRQIDLDTVEPVSSSAPDRAAENAEIRQRVRAALLLLPERQRLAVQMIDIEGRPPADVAAVLEVSPITARWHLMAGRRKLRRLLAPLVALDEPAHAVPETVNTTGSEAAFRGPRTNP